MKELKDITVLVCDGGLNVEAAIRMARDCKRVLYYVPNTDSIPKWNLSMIGHGMEGIEVVDDVFGEHFPYVDLFAFMDTGFGPLQCHLQDIGKIVWGSRMGENLEMEREECKEILKEVGLAVGPHQLIRGMDNLRAYLKEHEDQFVKVSRWRGTCESFYSKNYKNIEPRLDEIEFKLGPLKYLMEFDVEQSLPDMCEPGMDIYSVDGITPDVAFGGFEEKSKSFAGICQEYNKFPKPLTEFDRKIAHILDSYEYRGWYSSECRIGKDHVPYMIDFCGRAPHPPHEIVLELYGNYSEIVWQGANGNIVDPKPTGKFGVQLIMQSDWIDQGNWQPVDFDPKDRKWVKLTNACKIRGQYYSVPVSKESQTGSIIGISNESFEDAKKKCLQVAKGVSGYNLELPEENLDKAIECFATAEKEYNLKFF